ncbi:hypothetical protein GGS24DRAFT_446033 [Hypoxylon argillaceum]|nr:hypothetical protein GGS24DRAFT_446033 [Hypoxylon argillaceum]
MPPHISTSSSASGNSMADTPSNHDRRAITTIPGRGIHPSKLVNILQTRFGDNYTLQMRDDTYKIFAKSKISDTEIQQCY